MIENFIDCVEKFIQTKRTTQYFIEEGEIEFFYNNNENTKLYNVIMIRRIFLKEHYQKKGILTNFLNWLSEKFDEIWFLQCNCHMSFILLTTHLNGRFFVNRLTGEHYWSKNDKSYNHLKSEKIFNTLVPLKPILKDKEKFYKIINSNDELNQLIL
jgi:hypothetical protein